MYVIRDVELCEISLVRRPAFGHTSIELVAVNPQSACDFRENGYPLDSSDHYMLWLVRLVLVRHDDLAVGNGINRHGLLDKAIEQLATVP